MGIFAYGSPEYTVIVDDRILQHLEFVIIGKLRRGERFLFRIGDGSGPVTELWMSPDIGLRFEYSESKTPAINVAWLRRLAEAADGNGGLFSILEPENLPDRDLRLRRGGFFAAGR